MQEVRSAVRVILVDGEGRTLLFRSIDAYWFTPGGGLDEGEDLEAAARRELREEVGLEVGSLGDPLGSEQIEFVFEGRRIVQFQTYFRVRLEGVHEVTSPGFTEEELRGVTAHRWWTREEILGSSELIYPAHLLEWL